jgi:hypothetical protein
MKCDSEKAHLEMLYTNFWFVFFSLVSQPIDQLQCKKRVFRSISSPYSVCAYTGFWNTASRKHFIKRDNRPFWITVSVQATGAVRACEDTARRFTWANSARVQSLSFLLCVLLLLKVPYTAVLLVHTLYICNYSINLLFTHRVSSPNKHHNRHLSQSPLI